VGMTFYRETEHLENAYRRFGNIAYVDHWFGADCFKPPVMRNADGRGKLKKVKVAGRPFWMEPAIQLEVRRYERLSMKKRLDAFLITIDGLYPDIFPKDTRTLEKIARKEPGKDWRIEIIDAFESLTYQRQGTNKWLLIEMGKGYA